MADYTMTMNEETAGLVARALDFYARIGTGQLEMLTEHPSVQKAMILCQGADTVIHRRDTLHARKVISLLKELIFGLAGAAGISIYQESVPLDAKQAYDIKRVITHRLAWDRAGNPAKRDFVSMAEVAYDEPPHVCGDRPLPIFQRIST